MTEWEDHIYLPSDLSSMVELRIYASPKLGPMLGRGELQQRFSLSAGDLRITKLAIALLSHFNKRGDAADAEEARELLDSVRDICPPASLEYRSAVLVSQTRFMHSGTNDVVDPNAAAAFSSTQSADQQFPYSLDELDSKLEQCQQRDNPQLLDDVIFQLRDPLSFYVPGQPDLAIALGLRFKCQGGKEDLEEVILSYRQMLIWTGRGRASHQGALNNITILLLTRFEQGGDREDFEEAIQHHRDALVLRPSGHRDRGMSLNNIAIALSTWFEQGGDRKDLEEAIQHHRDALVLRPPGHPDRGMSLNNIANALLTRFEQGGDRKDLEEAIQHHRDALVLRPPGHRDRGMSLNNIANVLLTWCPQSGHATDPEEAIQLYRDALVLRPPGHLDRAGSLINLARALQARPPGHPDCAMLLNNIASVLKTQFEQPGGDRKDLEETLHLCHIAGAEKTLDHPFQVNILNTSADVHLCCYRAHSEEEYLHSAMGFFNAATALASGNLLLRLNSCMSWIQHAESHHHSSALDAYARSLQLLDSHVSATASISARHQARMVFPANLAVDAASCALRCGDICRALELLEQGRTTLWTQMAQFHTPLSQLAPGDPHAETLVQRFQSLSLMLNQQPADGSSTQNNSRLTAEAEAAQYRHLVDEWNQVVSQIQTIEGFSHFLLPPSFSDLQEASSEGPIIVLIASKFSCDAVIVLHQQSPIHICLGTTLKTLSMLTKQFWKEIPEFMYKQSEVVAQTLEELDLQSKSQISNGMAKVLRCLWATVVSPVVIELEKVGVKKDSRIWWCPSSVFTALPLHAAGPYHPGERNLEHHYISSYTPSLSTLIKACKMRDTPSSVSPHFAAIVQAQPAKHRTALYYPDKEANMIEKSVDSLLLPWLPKFCRAIKSSLEMLNGPLSLLDIIKTDLSKHEFVYLSACQTAVGDIKTPDEMIHLAAGLQFGGVKSVIGTRWSVHDGVAFLLASEFYKEFCADGVMDCTRAAGALHQALQSLRKQNIPLREQIMFIHIGI
ncbi:hypothetical protein BDN67DRAFT_1056352 [Paxillus ammoniavirescens]|nr:hypothetical protein BDN67DRAFT_1056352 [Paxillus ammoniavirescens]